MHPGGEKRVVAVIGCGHWGPNHVRVFSSLPDVDVAWAVDTSDDRRRRVASRFGGVRVASDHREVLEDASVDAVIIATPTTTHAQIALDAIRAGKHVLCEKPLASTSADCAALVDEAAARGIVLMVGHVFLFNRGILELKRLVDSGELGRTFYASATRVNLGPIRDDVNVAWDLAAHEIAILNFLFGAVPEQVSASGTSFGRDGIEDVAFITLRYPGDVSAGITVSWLTPEKVRRLSIVGERRMATFDDLAASPIAIHGRTARAGLFEPYYDSFGEFQRVAHEVEVAAPPVPREEPLLAQARCFVEATRTGEAGPVSGEHGGEVVCALEAITDSMRKGGAPVEVRRFGASRDLRR